MGKKISHHISHSILRLTPQNWCDVRDDDDSDQDPWLSASLGSHGMQSGWGVGLFG